MDARLLLCALLWCGQSVAYAQQLPPDDPRWIEQDWLAPRSKPEEALTLRLAEISLSTNHLDSIRLFYVQGMGMTLEGPLKVGRKTRRTLRRLWGIPDTLMWRLYRLHRPEIKGEIEIRLFVFDKPIPAIHASYDPLELGPLSIGFPNLDQVKLDSHLRSLGFGALSRLERSKIARPDGTPYTIYETIFNAPDFTHCVGITRGDGMRQMAPVDSATGHGGPGYSAQVVHRSDEVLAFYTGVLGLELRSDRQWRSSANSALGIPEGIPFRFAIVYPQGARTGQLLFLDFDDAREKPSAHPPRLPYRGIAMWTFETRNIAEIERRAKAANTPILHPRTRLRSPTLGLIEAMTLLAPNDFPVEIFQKIAR
jgi:catechol 2,3-dioxygenase-like lactoylglutathione lyase family enzyme